MNDWKKQLAKHIEREKEKRSMALRAKYGDFLIAFIAESDPSGRLPGGRNHSPEDDQ